MFFCKHVYIGAVTHTLSTANRMWMVHSCVGTTSTSEDQPLVRTRACGTALTAVYVHHKGTRVSIPHTYTDTIYGEVTHSNSDRGAKMPSGSVVRSLSLRLSSLHTRAADGEHTCQLLPVAACLRVLAGACLSIPIHPITCEYYLFEFGLYVHKYVCLCTQTHTHTRTQTHTHTSAKIHTKTY